MYFDSFEEVIDKLPSKDIGFEGRTRGEIKSNYRTFYSEENEKKYGVVAIKVTLM